MPFDSLMNEIAPMLREIGLRVLLAVLALLLTWAMRRVLLRLILVPFRRRLERTPLGAAVMDVLSQPILIGILALGIFIAMLILGIDPRQDTLLRALINTLLFLAVASAIYRVVLVVKLADGLSSATGVIIDRRLEPFLNAALRLVVIVLAASVILQEWGVNVSAIVAGLGVGTLGISLAAQDTVANLFGFVSIVADRPFGVGDYIAVQDIEGTVEHVGLRSTAIRKMDQSRVMIPNSVLNKVAISNWSRLQKRRFQLTLNAPADAQHTQMEWLLSSLRQMLSELPKVEHDTSVVLFTKINDNGTLLIELRGYILEVPWVNYMREVERINLEALSLLRRMATIDPRRSTGFLPQAPVISDENRQTN
ncbi:MAG: mechanosensitive ion channel family protein [Chloroflexi bacterium CFX4]|nr:mechanosensitive ion channel family protein [Chloroflexi bacterium CFX4]MDL1921380.1 mechanosensitive ion channel family protein [Chloroflexi bacterium CFX3]